MKINGCKFACSLALLSIVTSVALPAQTFTSLADFDQTHGAAPVLNSLVQGIDGALYGTTINGGSGTCLSAQGCGTVFKLNAGRLVPIYNFACSSETDCSNGAFPSGSLTLFIDGSFYGVAGGGSFFCNQSSGCGTIYKITPSGSLTTLQTFADFTNGYYTEGGLVLANDGNFYGALELGGSAACGCGTTFAMTPAGVLTTLHSFLGTDAAYPNGGLIQTAGGEFYGTALGWGYKSSNGSIFSMSPSGNISARQLSASDGATLPAAPLVQAADGNFYGTTEVTGDDLTGGGTVFKITPSGALTVLHTFCLQAGCPDGLQPQGALIQATDGKLYGMTRYGGNGTCPALFSVGCGTVFQITPEGVLTTIHSFDGTDGASPFNGLVQSTSGLLYGITYAGGIRCGDLGCGTIFSLDMGLRPFVAFVRPTGRAGQTAGILGQGFTGTTAVSFNGVSASFTMKSDTFLQATVPSAASSGSVTVTTPSGTLTSNVVFSVIP